MLVADGDALLDVGEEVLRGQNGLAFPLITHMTGLPTAAHREWCLEYELFCACPKCISRTPHTTTNGTTAFDDDEEEDGEERIGNASGERRGTHTQVVVPLEVGNAVGLFFGSEVWLHGGDLNVAQGGIELLPLHFPRRCPKPHALFAKPLLELVLHEREGSKERERAPTTKYERGIRNPNRSGGEAREIYTYHQPFRDLTETRDLRLLVDEFLSVEFIERCPEESHTIEAAQHAALQLVLHRQGDQSYCL